MFYTALYLSCLDGTLLAAPAEDGVAGAVLTTDGAGQLTLTAAPTLSGVDVNGNAGNYRAVSFETGGVERFRLGIDNVAESGSSSGSDFRIICFDDTGTFIDNAVVVNRASGEVTLSAELTIPDGTASGHAVNKGQLDGHTHEGFESLAIVQVADAVALSVKADAASATTTNVLECRDSSDNILFEVEEQGNASVYRQLGVAGTGGVITLLKLDALSNVRTNMRFGTTGGYLYMGVHDNSLHDNGYVFWDGTGGTRLMTVWGDGYITINDDGGNYATAKARRGTLTVHALSASHVGLAVEAASGQTADLVEVRDASGSVVFAISASGGIDAPNLPTSDPAVAGRVWKDSGTMKVSAG